jgi:hypothetical protein
MLKPANPARFLEMLRRGTRKGKKTSASMPGPTNCTSQPPESMNEQGPRVERRTPNPTRQPTAGKAHRKPFPIFRNHCRSQAGVITNSGRIQNKANNWTDQLNPHPLNPTFQQ